MSSINKQTQSLNQQTQSLSKRDAYFRKKECKGEICVVLDSSFDNRGLRLIAPASLALLKGEIHELIVTDEPAAKPGSIVNRIAYWGFFEVTEASVIVVDDEITVGDKGVGRIVGFDDTHMPNHLNIVIRTDKRHTGAKIDLDVGDIVRITKKS